MKSSRGERLRKARSKFYKSARAAAASLGIPAATYGAHERAELPGGRDYGPDEATQYGRRFGVSPEWLLTGSDLFDLSRDFLGPEPGRLGELEDHFTKKQLSKINPSIVKKIERLVVSLEATQSLTNSLIAEIRQLLEASGLYPPSRPRRRPHTKKRP